MFNFVEKIEKFIVQNFEPVSGSESDYSTFTSEAFLEFIFSVFPAHCIDEYDLYNILTKNNFHPSLATSSSKSKTKSIKAVWLVKLRQNALVLEEKPVLY